MFLWISSGFETPCRWNTLIGNRRQASLQKESCIQCVQRIMDEAKYANLCPFYRRWNTLYTCSIQSLSINYGTPCTELKQKKVCEKVKLMANVQHFFYKPQISQCLQGVPSLMDKTKVYFFYSLAFIMSANLKTPCRSIRSEYFTPIQGVLWSPGNKNTLYIFFSAKWI